MNLKRTGLYLLSLSLTGIFLTSIVAAVIYIRIEPQLPSIEALRDVRLQEPLRVYTHDHRLLAEFGEKRRSPVKIDEVPPLLVKAFLAAEDDRGTGTHRQKAPGRQYHHHAGRAQFFPVQ